MSEVFRWRSTEATSCRLGTQPEDSPGFFLLFVGVLLGCGVLAWSPWRGVRVNGSPPPVDPASGPRARSGPRAGTSAARAQAREAVRSSAPVSPRRLRLRVLPPAVQTKNTVQGVTGQLTRPHK